MTWPPNYVAEFARRERLIKRLRSNSALVGPANAYYADNLRAYINDWGITVDPRNAKPGSEIPANLPFVTFERQDDFIDFLLACLNAEANGLVEKSRDMGATWLCVGLSVWLWRYWKGSAIGWGSRKEDLVDKLGDMDSIFEKIRTFIRYLPRELLPNGFNFREHSAFMRLINPDNGATITGESGDNIGRGGRKLIYFKDEAQPLDAKILTPSGWQYMADMRVGSIVIGPDGQNRNVTHINECGVHDVYRVTFSDGTWTECSPNHLWTVDKVWGLRRRKIVTTAELASDLTYVSPGGQTQYKYRVPVCDPIQFELNGDLPLDPYIVGALLGDGSVKSGRIQITSADLEIVKEIERLLPNGIVIGAYDGRYGYNIIDSDGTGGKRKGGDPKKSSARLAVKCSGIYGMGAADKHIPNNYKFTSIENRLSVLQGLMDTDGSAANNYGGSASFHTSSPTLANDVVFIVQSLGGTATLNIKQDKRGFKDQYVLHIMLPYDMRPFRLNRKLNALKPRKHPPGRTILSIALSGRRTVRCITVDSLDGLYLTDNCIVTHNSAHYEHPEMIEASLGDNTNVQIDISSVHGLGNVFHRKREAGIEWLKGQPALKGETNVFVMDWSDHPAKDKVWHDRRRAEAVKNGLLHLFASEVDRDYAASVEGVIIPAEWVSAAIDAHLKLDYLGDWDSGLWGAGLDVADEGLDRNALVTRKGSILKTAEEWGERDTGVTTRKVVQSLMDKTPIEVQYDCIGVGSGVKSEMNRLKDEKAWPKHLELIAWNAGREVLYPNELVVPRLEGDEDNSGSPKNKDFYTNIKAQAWWELRRRFEKTYRAVYEGEYFNIDELISIDSTIPLLRSLQKELSQPTAGPGARLKMVVNKMPKGAKSPNLGDGTVMCFWPIPQNINQGQAVFGTYGLGAGRV